MIEVVENNHREPEAGKKIQFFTDSNAIKASCSNRSIIVKYYFPASIFLFKLIIPIQLNKDSLLNYFEKTGRIPMKCV